MSNYLRKTCKLHKITYNIYKHIYYGTRTNYATNVAVKEKTQNAKEEASVREYEKLSKIYQKKAMKRPKREPFVKNLFLGVFDFEMLAYPEALEKDDWEKLENSLGPIKTFMEQHKTNANAYRGMSHDYLANMKRLKVLGLQASQLFGGKELNLTETCRINEILCGKHDDLNVLHNEQLGINVLLKVCNEEQQIRYLERLINGNSIAALCMHETNCLDIYQTESIARYDPADKTWVLNGVKDFVVNGDSADLFIVLAKTDSLDVLKNRANKLTAFLVERSFGGVETKSLPTSGLRSTDIATVTFSNTKIPEQNIILNIHQGTILLEKIINDFRLSMAVASLSLAKSVLNRFIDYCKVMSQNNTNLLEADVIHSKIGQMSSSVYAMESMLYLTAGLLDKYDGQDCNMESAIVKAFNARHLCETTLSCLNFIGASSFLNDNTFNEMHQDALSYLNLHESLDSLKINIALQGLQHAGQHIQSDISKLRNPFYYFLEVLSHMWNTRRLAQDKPKLNLFLKHYLHPTLYESADLLEYSVIRLAYLTKFILATEGADIPAKHMILERFANAIMDIYAMTSTISRASRSYCIGLANANHELLIAMSFCKDAGLRIKQEFHGLQHAPYLTSDANFNKIASHTLKTKSYYPVHPLAKNF